MNLLSFRRLTPWVCLCLAIACVLAAAPGRTQDEVAGPATDGADAPDTPGAEAAERDEPPAEPPAPSPPEPPQADEDEAPPPAEPLPETEGPGPAGDEPEAETPPPGEEEGTAAGGETSEAPRDDGSQAEPPEPEPTEAATSTATGSRRLPARTAPRPRVVSRRVERQREAAVRQSLDVLAAPREKAVPESERLTALVDLVRQARMQLSVLQTEHAQFEAEQERLQARARQTAEQRERVPRLLDEGKLPLGYAEDTRDRAEATVTDMNELFDRGLARRAELVVSLERYRAELTEATQTARGLQDGELKRAWPAAIQVLQDRLDATRDLIALLDQIIAETVEVSEAGAQLSVELNRAIRLSGPRRLLARTAAPLSADSLSQIGAEVEALRQAGGLALRDARAALRRTAPWLGWTLTALLVAIAGLLWWALGRLPESLTTGRDPESQPDRSRLQRAAQLLVPAGRSFVLVALWATLTQLWRLPEGWWLAGLYLLGAWAAYFVFNFALRELFAPRHAEFRIVDLRQEAAQNLYRLAQALARYTVVLLPPIGLLSGIEQQPAECIRALQVIYGAGLLLIGLYVIRRAGGLGAVLPRPETRHKTALQQAGQLVLPLIAIGVLGGVIAAAGGYSNLSAYLSRSLTLELLVLMPAIFVYNLVLARGEGDAEPRWRPYGRWALWAVVIAVQVPIWRLHAYHATYALDLLRRSIITVEGAEVTGLTIAKGLAFILLSYLVARFVRSHLQAWNYLQARFQAGVAYAVSNLAFYLILAAGIVWGILASGFQLSVLTVFAGMAGIGLGFGLQNIVGNFVSGLILLIERPVAVGDFVEVSGLQGYITAINLRSTTIRTRDNNIVLVPNSDLAASIVTNLTISDPKVRVTVNIGVSYDSDLNLVRDLLRQAAEQNPNVLDDPAPRVLLMDFGSSSVDFTLYAWVANADLAITTGPELRMQIWDAFKAQNVEIPFPQRDLHIRSSDIPLPDPREPSGSDPPDDQ